MSPPAGLWHLTSHATRAGATFYSAGMQSRESSTSSGAARAVQGLFAVGAVWLIVTATRAIDAAVANPWLPFWDMSAHGVAGIHLADALRRFDIVGFGVEIYHMAGWPPLFHLLECPLFLAFGTEYSVATGLVATMFIVAIGAAMALAWTAGGSRGALLGAVTAALVATGPIVQQFGTIIMFEIVGLETFIEQKPLALNPEQLHVDDER